MFEQIRANKIRSATMVFVVAVILFAVSYFAAEYYAPGYGYYGIFIGMGIWLLLTLVSFYGGSSIYLSIAGARKIKKGDNPRLFNVVEEMKIAAGLPKMPDIYIIDDPIPNAFATGRSPDKSAVAVTTGLLKIMKRDELQGVIAHEIGHVKNRDVLYMLVVGIMVGAITLLSDIFIRSLFFGGGRSRSRSSSKGGSQAQLIMMAVALALIILSPIIARIVYLSISRKREYLADASGALFTRYPEGLASALEKIQSAVSSSPRRMAHVQKVTAPMYIVNPLVKKSLKRDSLWSTHPATENRIKILRAMSGVSFTDYNDAFKNINNTNSDIVGARSLKDAAPAAARTASAKETLSQKELARQSTDTVWKAGNYRFITCECGLKFKLPPNFPGNRIECPKCHRINTFS